MPFEEKSTVVTITAMTVVYGLYAVVVGQWARSTPVADIVYQPLLGLAVIALVVVLIAGNIAIAALNPKEAGVTDERDRMITLRAAQLSGYVLATGVFLVLVMAMSRVDQFWIANVLLLWWVAAEVAAGIARVALYRTGTRS